MDALQVHLALAHVPLAGFLFGLVFLGVGLLRRGSWATLAGLWLLCMGAAVSIPTFFSGEGSEEQMEGRPGVSTADIDEHEESAEFTFALLLVSGAVSGTAIIARRYRPRLGERLAMAALVGALVTSASLAHTAHLGGLIQHDELRAGRAPRVDGSD